MKQLTNPHPNLIGKAGNVLRSKKAFTYWMGYGAPPFLFGNIPISFWVHWTFGLLSLIIMSWFTWHTVSNVCVRCPHYGSRHCLVGGIKLPFLQKKSSSSISRSRIHFQYWADLGIMGYTIFCYSFFPLLLPVVIIGSVGALIMVYLPKRHHGLFHRLRNP